MTITNGLIRLHRAIRILGGFRTTSTRLSSNLGLQAFFITLMMFSFSPGAFAGTFNVFGPMTFQRGAGEPITIEKEFSVLNPNASYSIKIKNAGLVDDEFAKVSSSAIALNGSQIVGPSEFNQTVGFLQKPVDLGDDNTIAVQVQGKPGGAIVIEILGVDNDLPAITATVSPKANANGWHRTNPTVSFTCSDATSGIATCPGPIAISTEGLNQNVAGTAVDNAGNTATANVTINLDKTAPVISRTWPPVDSFGTDRSAIPVTGSLFDGLSGVSSAGLAGPTGTETLSSPNFDVLANLLTTIPAGQKAAVSQLQISVVDLAGNESTSEFRVLHTMESTMAPSDVEDTELQNGVQTSIKRALITFVKGTTRDRMHEVAESEGGRIAGILNLTSTAAAEFDTDSVTALREILDRLRELQDVKHAIPNFFLRPATALDNDNAPDIGSVKGGVAYHEVNLSQAANAINADGLAIYPVMISVIDSGLDPTFGANNEFAGIRYFNICTPEGQLGQPSPPEDPTGHGTEVTGVVAGANNGVGNNGMVRGINGDPFTVNVLKVSDCSGPEFAGADIVSTTFEAINSELIGHTNVVNMSYGALAQNLDDALRDEQLQFWIQQMQSGIGPDIVWVFAAGNEGVQTDCDGSELFFPAAVACLNSNVVAVGGYNPVKYNRLHNYGTAITLAAPSTGVLTAVSPGSYNFALGTSFASPMVAGAAALAVSMKTLASARVKTLLQETAKSLPDPENAQGGLDVLALVEAAKLEPDAVNNALQFDGVDDFVRIPHNANLSLTQFTIETWFRVDDGLQFFRHPFLAKGAEFGNYELGVLGAETAAVPGTVEYVQRTIDGNFSVGSPAEISLGVWHHVAVANSGTGTVNLYVDGNLVRTDNAAPVPLTNAEDLHIGAATFQGIGFQFQKGLIDEVRIWSLVRTPAEIAANFNRSIDPGTPGLVSYWNFDEPVDDQNVLDLIGVNNGTLGATNSAGADDPVRVPSTAPIVQ